MRLLKVIHTGDKRADSAIYLENYNMIAVSYKAKEIDFFKLPSWKLKKKFYFWRERGGLFLMKDKNMVGCFGTRGFGCKTVDFIQLHPQEDEKKI